MAFNSVNSQDYTTAAAAVNQNTDEIFDINRRTGPDYTAQAKTVIRNRANERNAIRKVTAGKKEAEQMGSARFEVDEIQRKSDKKIADIKRGGQRMAGFLGAVSTLNTAYATKRFNDEDKAERAEALRRQDARDAKWEALQQESIAAQSKPRPLSPELQKLYDELGITPPGGNTLPVAAQLLQERRTIHLFHKLLQRYCQLKQKSPVRARLSPSLSVLLKAP